MSRYQPPLSLADIPTIDQLVAHADKTVAGLDAVKRRVALLLYRHMVAGVTKAKVALPNLLLIGGSGSGKTHVLTTMLNVCPVPWVEGTATMYSPSGYTGTPMPSMYAGLVDMRWRGFRNEESWTQREMISHAERFGVVLLDEFDKLRMTSKKPTDREFGRPLQAELLKIVEGTVVDVKRFDTDRGFFFDTTNVLHIAVGAFEGLDDVMLKIDDVKDPTPQDKLAVHLDVDAYDVIEYGFLPELVGRFATIVPLPALDHEAMTRILVEHIIPSYRLGVESTNRKFHIDEGAISWFAAESTKGKVGARGIAPLFENVIGLPWATSQEGDTIALTAQSVADRQTAEIWPAKVAVAV